ncbi:hypothetical protein E3P92_00427 [Wallemia ichthyophaga]|nr:hypothetical protein E3P92_00427 [Wallemia ichthyophaga]TIB67668.1 hypothetical protein E3P77_01346 [Wallemia ichthyophaga]
MFKQEDHSLLVIPGPIEVSDEVLYANAHPSVSHVSPNFIPVFGHCIKMLRSLVYSDSAQPFIVSGSGTLGWDQVGSNLIESGDNALVINTGYFGDEFGNCLSVYGGNVDHLKCQVGRSVSIDQLQDTLKQKQYKLVTLTHVDTSTGVLSDIETVAKVVKQLQPHCLVVLDGVCSVGSELIRFDDWSIDVIVSASQKGIGAPPGLSLVWASERAIKVQQSRKSPASSYYANWSRWLPVMRAYESNQPAYFATPPVQLIYALNTTLKAIVENSHCSLEHRFRKHKEVSNNFKKVIHSWGLKQLACDEGYQANGMTTIVYPSGVKGADLLKCIVKRGVVAAGGLHKDCKDQYMRVGHMGESVVNEKRQDVDRVLQVVKEGLNELGNQLSEAGLIGAPSTSLALNILYYDADNSKKSLANEYLQSFQQTQDAWQISNDLLVEDNLPLELKLFAVQTFRSKIIYDFDQLPYQSLSSLKDTLLSSLVKSNHPRVLKTYLNLSLADLAIQYFDWSDPVTDYVESFYSANNDILLDFLTILPEEVNNQRIQLSYDQLSHRSSTLLTNNSNKVLQLLDSYIANSNTDNALVFNCLKSWLVSGEIFPSSLLNSNILSSLLNSLQDESLVESGIETLIVLINESQELQDNNELITVILLELSKPLNIDQEDNDAVRLFTRLYCQVGETYLPLMLSSPSSFSHVIQAIISSSSYHDLDIAQITFNFWYKLAHSLDIKSDLKPHFVPIYSSLLDIFINHLKFPLDESTITAQEYDDFRSFRHYIGDTLKDCCTVIGSSYCLSRSYSLILTAINSNEWQSVEAPLFSIRSMGSKVDYQSDNEILENIFNLLPNLPQHPRIKYAGILVASRFTEWINLKPDHIPFYMSFITTGFDLSCKDVDIPAASSQALKFLCEDCNKQLIPYLPQLLEFNNQLIQSGLQEDDHRSISESISLVIESISDKNDQLALIQKFTQPYLNNVKGVITKSTLSHDDIKILIINIEQIECYIAFTGPIAPLPIQCQVTFYELYDVFASIIVHHNRSSATLIERVCGLFRKGLRFFDEQAVVTVIPKLIELLTNSFDLNPLSVYIWLLTKAFNYAANDKQLISQSFNKISNKLFSILQSTDATKIPDLVEDYLHLLLQIIDLRPALVINGSVIQPIFELSLTALTLFSVDTILISLDFIRSLVGYLTSGDNVEVDKNTIKNTLSNHTNIANLTKILLQGLLNTFPEDCTSTVITLLRQLSEFDAALMKNVIPAIIQQSKLVNVGMADQSFFIDKYTSCIEACDFNGVRKALHELYRASKRSKERLGLIES